MSERPTLGEQMEGDPKVQAEKGVTPRSDIEDAVDTLRKELEKKYGEGSVTSRPLPKDKE